MKACCCSASSSLPASSTPTLTQQHHALQGQTGLQVFVFVVLAIYFVTFWSRGGQTVAMRAWHVRLVTAGGAAVTP